MSAQRTIAIETWGSKIAVVILPRTVDQPSRKFKSAEEALSLAQVLHAANGWPIEDRRS